MTHACVKIQIVPEAVASIPSWFGEVAVLAEVLTQFGLLKAIQEHVRFARARFGHYEVIDFVAVLLGYALSGEPTLEAFYLRLAPFATPFMALFGRACLPHRATLSRFLAALDQPSVEALRTLFQKDLVARPASFSPPGGLWDRQGQHWLVMDVDGTRQAARQRALPHTPDLPAPHRRLEQVCASGYLGRKRGEVVRTRTTILQAHTHQWVGTISGRGNGDYRGELLQALQAITSYATALSIPLAQLLVRLDGLYGNAAPLVDLLTSGLGVIVRGKDYALLDLPQVKAALSRPPDQRCTHPESGTNRTLFDCPEVPLTPGGLCVRMIVATHSASSVAPAIGVERDGAVYELFFTTMPAQAFTPKDVLDLYLHRGSFETVLSDEDIEQDPDRWCSHTPWGQEFWQILSQWVWNLRLELGQQISPPAMRLTEFAAASLNSPPPSTEPPVPSEPVSAPVIYGPPQWARPSFTGGFPGDAFALQPDGTLRCPANHPLYPQERRPERGGSVRVLYAARIGHCRCCPLRSKCQESCSTSKPRRVSAVFWPLSSNGPVVAEPPPQQVASPAVCPVLWGDWERCQIRRRWLRLLRTQTVILSYGQTQHEEEDTRQHHVQTRAQRAHCRLSWQQRLARNARSSTTPPLEVTIHGLPVSFAHVFGFDVVMAA